MSFDSVNKSDLLDFEKKIKFPFIELFKEMDSFFRKEMPSIKKQYESESLNDSTPFKKLEKIEIEIKKGIESITNKKDRLNDYKLWVILEDLELAQERILNLKNYNLWSRSNRLKNKLSGQNEIDYVTEQQETLEDIERKALSQNPDETWYELAVRNDLKEEDYDSEGGTPIKVIYRGNNSGTFIRTTIDIIDKGEKIYGRDLNKKIQFLDDDLLSLDNQGTKIQSVEILSGLRKGSNPKFLNSGVDMNSVVGSNRNSILFPSIFRQLVETFRTDDSFSGVGLKRINIEKDALFVDFEVYTRFNEVIETVTEL